tara:strand:- start:3110 stop:3331 length:222 start_codon:yes stop_codon:yes gene_type:complete
MTYTIINSQQRDENVWIIRYQLSSDTTATLSSTKDLTQDEVDVAVQKIIEREAAEIDVEQQQQEYEAKNVSEN